VKNSRILYLIVLSALHFLGASCSSDRSDIAEVDYDQVLHFQYDEVKYGEPDLNALFQGGESPLLFEMSEEFKEFSLKKLLEQGFSCTPVPSHKHDKLHSIFQCEPMTTVITTDCIAIYRDILVFKKQKEIVKIAQLCFGCDKAAFVGPWPDMFSFGQRDEFKQLEDLLKQ
jgi:hypothetical protein